MCKQLSLLPLMHQFDYEGFITHTTYADIDDSEKDVYYLVFHTATYTMFLPREKSDWLGKTVNANKVVITKGSYNGKKDCFELMFINRKKTLHTIILTDDQFVRETPLKENCWYGKMYIYRGGLYDLVQDYKRIYYRVADTLPYCKPVEE